MVDQAFKQLASPNGDHLAVGAWVLGPFTMAGQIIELDILLKGAKKDKERTEDFLAKMTDLVIQTANHYESLGADYVTIREMGTGTDLLSPRMWKMLIQANLTRVFDAISRPTVKAVQLCVTAPTRPRTPFPTLEGRRDGRRAWCRGLLPMVDPS